jgi:hypothetical protein
LVHLPLDRLEVFFLGLAASALFVSSVVGLELTAEGQEWILPQPWVVVVQVPVLKQGLSSGLEPVLFASNVQVAQ